MVGQNGVRRMDTVNPAHDRIQQSHRFHASHAETASLCSSSLLKITHQIDYSGFVGHFVLLLMQRIWVVGLLFVRSWICAVALDVSESVSVARARHGNARLVLARVALLMEKALSPQRARREGAPTEFLAITL